MDQIYYAVRRSALYLLNVELRENGVEAQSSLQLIQEQRKEMLKCLLEREVFKFDEWKPYVNTIFEAGIVSIEILMDTSHESLNRLPIPQGPLVRLQEFATNLVKMKTKNASQNNFVYSLSSNSLVHDFEFIPKLTYLQYLDTTQITDKENELKKAIRKVEALDYKSDGLSKLEAVFLALYCQESTGGLHSFYSIVNRTVRERQSQQFLDLRPALYLPCNHQTQSSCV